MSNETKEFALTQEEETLLLQKVKYGEKAKKAKEVFFDEYFEAQQIALLSQFVRAKVADSKRIFEIKYAVDALTDLHNRINFLISDADAAKIQLNLDK